MVYNLHKLLLKKKRKNQLKGTLKLVLNLFYELIGVFFSTGGAA